MTNRHGKNRNAKRRMGHKRPAPSDRLPESVDIERVTDLQGNRYYIIGQGEEDETQTPE